MTPWTVACQAPLSMVFARQKYWSRWPFPSPGDLPNPVIEPVSLALQAGSLPLSHQGSPYDKHLGCFLGSSGGKESACNARDMGLIPGSGRSPGEVSGNPLQYSCLENPTDREAWGATVHGVTKSGTNRVTEKQKNGETEI